MITRISVILFGTICLFITMESWAADAKYLYWSNEVGIGRATVDGGDRTVVTDVGDSYGLAFDAHSQEIYWLSDTNLFKSNLTGTSVTNVALPLRPTALALDVEGRLSSTH